LGITVEVQYKYCVDEVIPEVFSVGIAVYVIRLMGIFYLIWCIVLVVYK